MVSGLPTMASSSARWRLKMSVGCPPLCKRCRMARLCAADSGPCAPSSGTGRAGRRASSGTKVGRLLQLRPKIAAVMRAMHSPRARRWLCEFIGLQSRRRAALKVPLMLLVGLFAASVCALSRGATQGRGAPARRYPCTVHNARRARVGLAASNWGRSMSAQGRVLSAGSRR